MHELSVCIALLDKVQQVAADHGASKVSQIIISLGPLSGVEAPLLRNAYPLAAAGTVAADAELTIEVAAVKVRCRQCGSDTEVPTNRLLCGTCGDYRTNILSGDELLLQRIELETPGTPRKNATSLHERRSV